MLSLAVHQPVLEVGHAQTRLAMFAQTIPHAPRALTALSETAPGMDVKLSRAQSQLVKINYCAHRAATLGNVLAVIALGTTALFVLRTHHASPLLNAQ